MRRGTLVVMVAITLTSSACGVSVSDPGRPTHAPASAPTQPPTRTPQEISVTSPDTMATSPGGSPTHDTGSGPAATVWAYIAAINAHDYARAWALGGDHTGQSYTSFSRGFATTAQDTLTITGGSGDTVKARLVATQTDGSQHIYQGSYTVVGGVITAFAVRQVS